MFVHAPPLTGCTSTAPAPVELGWDARAAMYESDIATLFAARPRFCTAPPDQRCTTSSVAVPLPFKSGLPLTREPVGHPGWLGVGPAASGRRKAAMPFATATASAGHEGPMTAPVLASKTWSTVSSRSPSPVRSAERSLGSDPRTKTSKVPFVSPLTRL